MLTKELKDYAEEVASALLLEMNLRRETNIFNATMSKLERDGFLDKLDKVAFPSGQSVTSSAKQESEDNRGNNV